VSPDRPRLFAEVDDFSLLIFVGPNMTEPKKTNISRPILPVWMYIYFLWLIGLMWLDSFGLVHCIVVMVIGLVPLRIGYLMSLAQIWGLDRDDQGKMTKEEAEEEVEEVIRNMERTYWLGTIKAHVIFLFIYLSIRYLW